MWPCGGRGSSQGLSESSFGDDSKSGGLDRGYRGLLGHLLRQICMSKPEVPSLRFKGSIYAASVVRQADEPFHGLKFMRSSRDGVCKSFRINALRGAQCCSEHRSGSYAAKRPILALPPWPWKETKDKEPRVFAW